MKFALWIIGLFALAVLIGLSSTLNVGYAILYVPPYRIDLSINSLIIGIVALFAVVYFIIRLLANASGLPAEVRRYQRKRKLHNARAALCRAGIWPSEAVSGALHADRASCRRAVKPPRA